MSHRQTAIISSTVRDLPDYRNEVMRACLRMDVFPEMMENLPALDADAIAASLGLVNKADIYIGIFAHRYGYVPKENNPKQISITEMEYDRATERKIPRLIFLMDENHPVIPADVDKGPSAQKLEFFKQRLNVELVRDTFTTKEDLRGKLIYALGELKKQLKIGDATTPDVHPPNIIPKPPESYIAHPYSLLQTKDVVGRQAELNLLTDWVTTNKLVSPDIRIFNFVAIGGMGKSSLTWKWFNDIVPNELPKLAGRMWWSFYESDAYWENFIIRALAYVSEQPESAVREMKSPDREDQLWHILDQKPFLFVLDGLERILLAYARIDAAQMLDDDLDNKTSNRVNETLVLPKTARQSFIGKHKLRRTADHRAGHFLRRLARVKQSRILITTRLYPAELQTDTGNPLPGCFQMFLHGLTEDDALNLWREFKVSGSKDQLIPLFNSFDNYPLLIRALAGEVAAFRSAPGDFDKWRNAHPQFEPAGLPLKNAQTHVLKFALGGLSETQQRVLHTVAAFRMPTAWETLYALLVHAPLASRSLKKANLTEVGLDVALTELEDRGLIGWDRIANRYDMHPIVRSVVWEMLDQKSKHNLYTDLNSYFESLPFIEQDDVKVFDELSNAIEYYHNLICLRRFDDAFSIFRSQFEAAAMYRFSHSRQCAELLKLLFVDGLDSPPRLSRISFQIAVLNALAQCYHFCGEPSKSEPLYAMAHQLIRKERQYGDLITLLYNASWTLRPTGKLHQSQSRSREALQWARKYQDRGKDAISTQEIGLTLETRGVASEAKLTLIRSIKMFKRFGDDAYEGIGFASIAQLDLHLKNLVEAGACANRAWELAMPGQSEKDLVCAARLQGEIALALGDFVVAQEKLNLALTRSRAISFVEEELPALVALAEMHRAFGGKEDVISARGLIEEVIDPAERGPYPLFHADALNVLAQIERDQNKSGAAIAAATKAYKLAWCDGPPYAYHYGLTNARKHLQELGAQEPKLLPFDESKFEPLPEVELNPKDEFWVDPDKLDSELK